MKKKGDMTELSSYIEPLRLLEQSFRKAGIEVEFTLTQYPNGTKIVELSNQITHEDYCVRPIGNNSVAQVIKDITNAVEI
jgi:hypothetical protein